MQFAYLHLIFSLLISTTSALKCYTNSQPGFNGTLTEASKSRSGQTFSMCAIISYCATSISGTVEPCSSTNNRYNTITGFTGAIKPGWRCHGTKIDYKLSENYFYTLCCFTELCNMGVSMNSPGLNGTSTLSSTYATSTNSVTTSTGSSLITATFTGTTLITSFAGTTATSIFTGSTTTTAIITGSTTTITISTGTSTTATRKTRCKKRTSGTPTTTAYAY